MAARANPVVGSRWRVVKISNLEAFRSRKDVNAAKLVRIVLMPPRVLEVPALTYVSNLIFSPENARSRYTRPPLFSGKGLGEG